MSQASTAELSIREHIATITIRGAARSNALGLSTLEAIIRIGEELRRDDALRLVILTGEGQRAFIGGADIYEMAQFDQVSARNFITKVHHANHMFRLLPVPSIARINGYCLGAGMETAAACDLRIGSDNSRYGMPEVQVGLPSVVETTLFSRLIGEGKTRELVYRGHLIDAAEAQRIGFLQKLVPLAELDAGMQPWIDDILAADPAAIRAQKRLMETWIDSGVGGGIIASIDALSGAFLTDAPSRRLQAYVQRRKSRQR
ncbi:MAG: enoyl-CoA hydratase/isomerase family protein [Candidatus Lambdaproteobacteria bacterium]|nr:enoyl-CoA hydratase/isomerase family protein [Candidatus Lambdaproteobacteria bacterium]